MPSIPPPSPPATSSSAARAADGLSSRRGRPRATAGRDGEAGRLYPGAVSRVPVPGRRRAYLSAPAAVLLLLAVAVVVLLATGALGRLNPFGTETHDRSQPPLRQSLVDLASYHAASANLQVVVDVEQDSKLLPGFLKGRRTLFVAAGSVDAAVDFGALARDPGAVRESPDRAAATITLPAPALTAPRLDPDRTRVYDEQRGLLDRLGDAVSGTPGDQQPYYQLASRKLAAAAAADPALRATAERNTRAMLTGLLRGLGYRQVTVRFRPPPV